MTKIRLDDVALICRRTGALIPSPEEMIESEVPQICDEPLAIDITDIDHWDGPRRKEFVRETNDLRAGYKAERIK